MKEIIYSFGNKDVFAISYRLEIENSTEKEKKEYNYDYDCLLGFFYNWVKGKNILKIKVKES